VPRAVDDDGATLKPLAVDEDGATDVPDTDEVDGVTTGRDVGAVPVESCTPLWTWPPPPPVPGLAQVSGRVMVGMTGLPVLFTGRSTLLFWPKTALERDASVPNIATARTALFMFAIFFPRLDENVLLPNILLECRPERQFRQEHCRLGHHSFAANIMYSFTGK
jgi:hypothetical protein